VGEGAGMKIGGYFGALGGLGGRLGGSRSLSLFVRSVAAVK
jgi:hypothetical protein